MNELLSIVVPIYDVSNYLDDCIQSIIKQTYLNIEVILETTGINQSQDELYFKDLPLVPVKLQIPIKLLSN